MGNCEHKNIVLTMNGWYCPSCGKFFDEKPKPIEREIQYGVKPKKNSRSTAKK